MEKQFLEQIVARGVDFARDYGSVMLQSGPGKHTLEDSMEIFRQLTDKLPATSVIFHGDHVARCCVDDLTAMRANCEAIIYIGDTCFAPSSLPHLVLPSIPDVTDMMADATAIVEACQSEGWGNVVLVAEYSNWCLLPALADALVGLGLDASIQQMEDPTGELKSIHGRFVPADATPVYVGAESALETHLRMDSKIIHCSCPGVFVAGVVPTRRRYGVMNSLKQCTCIGLLPILHAPSDPLNRTLDALERHLESRRLPARVCYLADPTPDKMTNFPEIDGWVVATECPNTAVPQWQANAFFDRSTVPYPVATVMELLASIDSVDWFTTRYQTDLRNMAKIVSDLSESTESVSLTKHAVNPVTWVPATGGPVMIEEGMKGRAERYQHEG
ncbi:Diphthamide synthesis DPH1/DPH2 [Carpediemonas membranifera]|uniref:Diphthamide synthesis DPH1/DPH2 n=1 Tax=Carpediemonas membranifera TaxID=201153 RepID=A0A8J6AVD5_9EUKA|nr:Diphthamide synthesis DPH1/DPH2 [Carpediemonas membranifera]|eukprot:KAG9392535.1 Diphthamide synthesis DPH1/DPH2 [Carpediemonas membranifera]